MYPDGDLDRLIHHFCVAPRTAHYGPYLVPPGEGDLPQGTDLIPGRLRRYRLIDQMGKSIDLHIYTGLGEVGGLL